MKNKLPRKLKKKLHGKRKLKKDFLSNVEIISVHINLKDGYSMTKIKRIGKRKLVSVSKPIIL